LASFALLDARSRDTARSERSSSLVVVAQERCVAACEGEEGGGALLPPLLRRRLRFTLALVNTFQRLPWPLIVLLLCAFRNRNRPAEVKRRKSGFGALFGFGGGDKSAAKPRNASASDSRQKTKTMPCDGTRVFVTESQMEGASAPVQKALSHKNPSTIAWHRLRLLAGVGRRRGQSRWRCLATLIQRRGRSAARIPRFRSALVASAEAK
jgi:hypothetical protein